jgi:hypothetical protein
MKSLGVHVPILQISDMTLFKHWSQVWVVAEPAETS